MLNSIFSSATDIGAYSADRGQAEVGAKPLLCGRGLAKANKLLDIRNRRDDCGKREVHHGGCGEFFLPNFAEL